ncbi:MAG: hypothetical protein H0W68_08970 [Gemmatimonadaceae bacterium]|nr:hypothetical protein [Gemmatimonadaceae bacterium]
MTTQSTRHLVTVWNPSYAESAMDEHLRVLRLWSQRAADAGLDDDEVYVWWGKVKSSNRQQPMAHLDETRAVGEQDEDTAGELHLYLTDYRSLYVGELIEVAGGELPEAEHGHAPAYYKEKDLRCDLWFKLGDIRRLVVDDTLGVVEELKKLHNVHYNDRPVSIYGGMVNLPLVVTRPDGTHYFDPDQRESLAGDKLWAEFDAELGAGIAATERDLRENRFGATLWQALEPAARIFIASGERVYREHRADPAFDFAMVLTSFAKAIEVQGNAILRRAMPKLKQPQRMANLSGQTVDLREHRDLGLGELARAISGEQALNDGLARLLGADRWFRESFPTIASALAEVRNPGAHSAVIDRATATKWRARMIGVGCEGDLVALARVRVR